MSKDGCKKFMVLRVKPTPTGFTTYIPYTVLCVTLGVRGLLLSRVIGNTGYLIVDNKRMHLK